MSPCHLAEGASQIIVTIENRINQLPRKMFDYEDAESKFQAELSRVS